MTRFENDSGTSHPLETMMEAGSYCWCRCGRTKTVPYCDGSHAGTGVTPLTFEVEKSGVVAICNCGLTDDQPYCDGSHTSLE
jgi:methylamine---glutamate N-methyltransferase subunit C